MMTNTKMSIFNKYQGTYKKHVIDNVFWDDTKSILVGNGFEKQNNVTVFIPKDKNDLSEYIPPKSYNGNGFTFNKGDYIIKGEVAETEINGIKDLSSYETFTITSVDNKDFGSPSMHHFMIQGE